MINAQLHSKLHYYLYHSLLICMTKKKNLSSRTAALINRPESRSQFLKHRSGKN